MWARLADAFLDPRCLACRAEHSFAAPDEVCAECRRQWLPARMAPPPEGLPRLHAAWDYAGAARVLIGRAKDAPEGVCARLLLGEARPCLERAGAGACFVPAPSSRWRWGRSLAHELARAAARQADGRMLTCLRRSRTRPPQSRLDGAARRTNLHGAMTVRRLAIEPHALLRAGAAELWLVDDVCTTGATLAECGRALRAAGLAPTGALVLARVA